jgi:hypothetical protein
LSSPAAYVTAIKPLSLKNIKERETWSPTQHSFMIQYRFDSSTSKVSVTCPLLVVSRAARCIMSLSQISCPSTTDKHQVWSAMTMLIN